MQTIQTLLIAVHLMVVVALVGVVLLQRSEGGALGMGGGGGFFTGRGQANALTRATGILGGLFFATSIALTLLAGWGKGQKSVFNAPNAPNAPISQPASDSQQAPNTPGSGGVLDELRKVEEQRQSAPRPNGASTTPMAPRSQ